MADKRSEGVYAPERTWDAVDDRATKRRRRGMDGTTRSRVAADALALGIVALEILEEHGEARYRPQPEQKAMLREALSDYLDREFRDT